MRTLLLWLAVLLPLSFVMENTMGQTVTLTVAEAETEKTDNVIYRGAFDSLPAAVAKARQYGAGTRRSLLVGDGTHYLEEPLVLDHRDNGLTLAAEPGTRPVLTGGRPLANWRPDGPSFWSADVPETREGAWDFRILIVNGRFCPRARRPESGCFEHHATWDVPWMSTTGGGWKRKPTREELTALVYDPNDLGPGLDLRNAELTLYHMWDESLVGVAALDGKTHTLTLSSPAGHPPGAFGVRRYVVWNVREGLTKPGQWYLDRTRGKVVYWPLPGEDMATAHAIAPTTEAILRLEGTEEKAIREIAIRGLTLSVSNTPLRAGGFGGIGHPGALEINFAHDSLIHGLTITNVGGHGIKEVASQGLRIERCHIHTTGAGGILFGQGDKVVQDNHIHHIGLLYPSAIGVFGRSERVQAHLAGRPGPDTDGLGEEGRRRIAHNEIHDTPYTAIACTGNGYRIESNLIYRAMQQLEDGAAIYICLCKGIVLRGNFVRDLPSLEGCRASAYYLDEQSEHCVVEGNLSVGVACPSHNHMARNNTIRGNVFLHAGDLTLSLVKSTDYVLEHNIVQAEGSITLKDADAIARMTGNVLFSRTRSVSGLKGDDAIEDPRIRHDGEGRIVMETGSPTRALGIAPLDVSDAGVRRAEDAQEGSR